MQTPRVTVIGAGAGGLAAAIDLARQGAQVTLLDKAGAPGGKIRIDGAGIDSGPTVLTMRWVFEALFADAGTTLDQHLTLHPAEVLARHAWSATERLDLFADPKQSADAIAAFAGPAEAEGFRTFCARAERVYRTLEKPFMRSQRPTALSLAAATGVSPMLNIAPFVTLWKALGDHFRDPRLRQLFGRYATYSGSSPFLAPATLMLIAHVEQQGVWMVQGGMIRLPQAMAALAIKHGAVLRQQAPVAEITTSRGRATGVRLTTGEQIESDAIVCNADCAALATGLFGRAVGKAVPPTKDRSLSALTWTVKTTTGGFPLTRHNVFFGRDYAEEFDAVFRRGRLPNQPTVYVCAQDRGEQDRGEQDRGEQDRGEHETGPERLLLLVNAPPNGQIPAMEIERCATRTFDLLRRCGLTIQPADQTLTTPAQFEAMFPATGGALYGRAVHGSMAAFRRPGSRSAVPGLYLAGGSVHPGPGVPMAVLSGRLAAAAVLRDLTSA